MVCNDLLELTKAPRGPAGLQSISPLLQTAGIAAPAPSRGAAWNEVPVSLTRGGSGAGRGCGRQQCDVARNKLPKHVRVPGDPANHVQPNSSPISWHRWPRQPGKVSWGPGGPGIPSPLRGQKERLGWWEPPLPMSSQRPACSPPRGCHHVALPGSEDDAHVRSAQGSLGCSSPEPPARTFPLLLSSFRSRPIAGSLHPKAASQAFMRAAA